MRAHATVNGVYGWQWCWKMGVFRALHTRRLLNGSAPHQDWANLGPISIVMLLGIFKSMDWSSYWLFHRLIEKKLLTQLILNQLICQSIHRLNNQCINHSFTQSIYQSCSGRWSFNWVIGKHNPWSMNQSIQLLNETINDQSVFTPVNQSQAIDCPIDKLIIRPTINWSINFKSIHWPINLSMNPYTQPISISPNLSSIIALKVQFRDQLIKWINEITINQLNLTYQ